MPFGIGVNCSGTMPDSGTVVDFATVVFWYSWRGFSGTGVLFGTVVEFGTVVNSGTVAASLACLSLASRSSSAIGKTLIGSLIAITRFSSCILQLNFRIRHINERGRNRVRPLD